jgi:hypothetical protein
MLSSEFWNGRAFFLLGGWRLAEWVVFPANNRSVRQNTIGGLGTPLAMFTCEVNSTQQSYVTALSEIYVDNLSECHWPRSRQTTWTTYGTWLPGEARSWVCEKEWGIQAPDSALEQNAWTVMAESALAFTGAATPC